jgi:hypothetical protein
MEQALVQLRFVAQQQKPFGVGVEPANGINVLRETKIGQRALAWMVRRELGQDAIWFVESNEHDAASTACERKS